MAQQDLLKQSHDSYKVLGEVVQKQALAAVPVVVGEPWDLQWEYTSENMCVWVVKKWGITVELAVLRCVGENSGDPIFRQTQMAMDQYL